VSLYFNGLEVAGTVLPRNFCTLKERLGAGLGGCATYVVRLPPAGPERSGCGAEFSLSGSHQKISHNFPKVGDFSINELCNKNLTVC
jgi:hypothetical protein